MNKTMRTKEKKHKLFTQKKRENLSIAWIDN